MKSFSVLLVVVVLCALGQARPEDDKYTTKYDSFDVDKVLDNHRLFVSYMNCMLEKGKCTKEGTELKSHLAEALETECAKCTEKQKEVGRRVLKHVYEKEQEYFKQLEEKYDHSGAYRKRYQERAKKEGIDL